MTAPLRPRSVSLRLARIAGAATVVALAASALAACASPNARSTPAPTAAVEIPSSPVGAQAAWVLDEINADEEPRIDEIERRFDPATLEQLPAADLQSVLVQLQDAAPWTPTAYEEGDRQARVTITSAEVTYDMTLSVTADDLIDGLLFGPTPPEREPAALWEELREQVESAPFDATVQVTDVGGETLQSFGRPGAAPIGSIFKLWVLGAVADAVGGGSLTWDDPLVIDAGVRSLPSGELQNLPDGATVTVREAAEKMIAISDNTATDALIRAVGRDAVEQAMAAMGHADPSLNTPFPTTRELFWLLLGDADLRTLWGGAAGDAEARRSVLERLPAGVPDPAAMSGAQPAWRDGVDWFATADDLTAAHAALQERALTPAGAPLRDILSANPGVEFGDRWSYVAFKGGSSIGVLAGSWYLEREGATPVVVTVLARSDDPAALVHPSVVFGWAQDAAAILGAP
ncbi:serine hydrolase [Microbacterium thalli]|uniref:Cpe/LpqF family protein n=1 Tax=Microbacterium thalli TaxID=3027921 RepID=A0ABT5SFW6_9MICO|nr:Cpe/LpqF family protein [Microbacterium thalli]MDD7961709.1 Cpe/LpqF family protein [Microbacterium thalli]